MSAPPATTCPTLKPLCVGDITGGVCLLFWCLGVFLRSFLSLPLRLAWVGAFLVGLSTFVLVLLLRGLRVRGGERDLNLADRRNLFVFVLLIVM